MGRKLYVNRKGTIGITNNALELLDIQISNESFVGVLEDFAENCLYLYGSTPTSEKFKRKLQFEKTNKLYYITLKQDIMERLFSHTLETYLPMELEEEPYNINGIECYKIIL